MGLHEDATGIHTVANWTPADSTALAAIVPVSGDDGKVAWQQDTDQLWLLTDYSVPTWVEIGAAPGATPSGEITLIPSTGWPSTTNGCAAATATELGSVNIYTFDYDPDAIEYAEWTVMMHDDWDAGSITAQFIWTAASGSGGVVWGLQARGYDDDDPINVSWSGAYQLTDTLTAANDICISAESSGASPIGNPVAGGMVQFRCFRLATNGSDTLAADAKLIAIKVRYSIA